MTPPPDENDRTLPSRGPDPERDPIEDESGDRTLPAAGGDRTAPAGGVSARRSVALHAKALITEEQQGEVEPLPPPTTQRAPGLPVGPDRRPRPEVGAVGREHPVEADCVIAIPDSGNAAALGYSQESGIPFEQGFIRNHYVGRTFIQPSQAERSSCSPLRLPRR